MTTLHYDDGIVQQALGMLLRLHRDGCEVGHLIDPRWLRPGPWRAIGQALIDGPAAVKRLEGERRDEMAVLAALGELNTGAALAASTYAVFMEQGDDLRRRDRARVLIARAADGAMAPDDLLAALQATPIECGDHDPAAELARRWSVPRSILTALGVGWRDDAWVFPLRNAEDAVVGVLATDGDREWPIGTPRGAVRPIAMACSGPLLYCERLDDLAAASALGLDAVRPMPGSSAALARVARGRDLIVLVRRDSSPQWINGAGLNAGRSRTLLRAFGGAASFAEWYGAGVTRVEVLDLVRAVRGW